MAGQVLTLLFVVSSVCLFVGSIDEIAENKCGVVPKLFVSYGPGTDEDVTCGQSYTVTDSTVAPPKLKFSPADETAQYTLLMVDPDAPFPDLPRARYWLHWLVVNIPGTDIVRGGNLVSGTTIYEYSGPSPPRGPVYHRYFFYLFKQPASLSGDAATGGRARFDVAKFVANNDLEGPTALNMFKVRKY